ncbi:be2271e8-e575-4727-9cea-0151190e28ca [Thermothielavioides terrestris]|uniref:Be2271e8-e575-4727-9cea-0151190e28ca n=1 Tax=Thermothielavioides terrestris TaxID=2587410 RepID=A0A3S5CXL0_9PEZI|nr:be2271e8-e575-4727-9cea-0151190e28ca [Thermothielavioides terrestris]
MATQIPVETAPDRPNNGFTITQVTVADGPALAATNIPAFWADPHWRLDWRHRTLEYHISQVALRYPRTLLRNRTTARHQKAVDTATGEILGYARWTIPEPYATVNTAGDHQGDGSPAWPEAQVPAVSAEEEAEISRVADTAVWDPDSTSDPLQDAIREIKDELLARKPYMILDYLAVHPKHQRRGIATALVRSGMQQAEKLGLDIFVHAMKPGVPVYQRLGFRLERELTQDDSQYGGPGLFTDYFMIYSQPDSPANGNQVAN